MQGYKILSQNIQTHFFFNITHYSFIIYLIRLFLNENFYTFFLISLFYLINVSKAKLGVQMVAR
jgi:hypothetical protein